MQQDKDEFDAFEDDIGVVWRDCLLNGLGAMFVFFVAAVLMIHPKVKPQDLATVPGTIMVELFWDDKNNVDVDLWVKAPGDQPVGFTRKNGIIFSLLRDDTGFFQDPSEKNFENAYAQSSPEGFYVVNAHLYSSQQGKLPVAVKVVISSRPGGNSSANMKPIYTGQAVLQYQDEEITLAKFYVDKYGNIANNITKEPTKIVKRPWNME